MILPEASLLRTSASAAEESQSQSQKPEANGELRMKN
jgi:hypothetical protein